MEQAGLLQAISSMLDEKTSLLDEKISLLDEKFEKLEKRLFRLEHAVIDLRLQQNEMQETLKQHGEKITRLETAMENLQKTVTNHYQLIEDNFVGLKEMQTRMMMWAQKLQLSY